MIYIHTLGETGELGWTVVQADGSPMPLAGLALRLVLRRRDGDEIVLPCYATTGEVLDDGDPLAAPSVMAYEFGPATPEIPVGLYRAAREYNDGEGWRAFPESEFLFRVRSAAE